METRHPERDAGPGEMPIVLTRTQVRELDRLAVERYGIPSIVLMENAAISCVPAAMALVGRSPVGTRRVAVFCGTGNNGGDGLAIARHLANRGSEVVVLMHGEPRTPDARTNLDIVRRMGMPVFDGGTIVPDAAVLSGVGVVVDALIGTGLSRAVDGELARAIGLIRRMRSVLGASVLAVDVPSGLDADTGMVLGGCVEADVTVTLAAFKPGLRVEPGRRLAGAIEVGSIGVPPDLVREVAGWRG